MNEFKSKIQEVINRHSQVLSCGAIIHKDGKVSDKTGDFAEFDKKGLSIAVLGPYGSPISTYKMVSQYENDRSMLPQGMSQGGLIALMDKPGIDYVVVVFGKKNTDFIKYLEERNSISNSIYNIFN